MPQKATIIVEGTFTPDYAEHFEEYSAKVSNYLQKFGTRVIRRQLVKATLYGSDKPDLVMVIDFDDEAVAKRIFFEDEYLAIIPLRDKIFRTFNMYLASADNV